MSDYQTNVPRFAQPTTQPPRTAPPSSPPRSAPPASPPPASPPPSSPPPQTSLPLPGLPEDATPQVFGSAPDSHIVSSAEERAFVCVRRVVFVDADATRGVQRGTHEVQASYSFVPVPNVDQARALDEIFRALDGKARQWLGEMAK